MHFVLRNLLRVFPFRLIFTTAGVCMCVCMYACVDMYALEQFFLPSNMYMFMRFCFLVPVYTHIFDELIARS